MLRGQNVKNFRCVDFWRSINLTFLIRNNSTYWFMFPRQTCGYSNYLKKTHSCLLHLLKCTAKRTSIRLQPCFNSGSYPNSSDIFISILCQVVADTLTLMMYFHSFTFYQTMDHRYISHTSKTSKSQLSLMQPFSYTAKDNLKTKKK